MNNMDAHITQLTPHAVLTEQEERALAQRIESARQAVSTPLCGYRPATTALLQRYDACRRGVGRWDETVLGLYDHQTMADTDTRPPSELSVPLQPSPQNGDQPIPPAWTALLEQLRACMQPINAPDPYVRQRSQGQQIKRIWESLRLHPHFLHHLVENFITAVEQRAELESRIAQCCRRSGRQPPAALQDLQRLADSNHAARHPAKRLLQFITSSGLSQSRLQTVQAQIVLALTRLHREKSHLIIANQRLVVSIARPFARTGIPIQDLIQEGNLGLLRAVDGFDFRLGYKFSTYAVWWIRRAIIRAVSAQSGPVRIPFDQDLARYKVERTRSELTQQLGRLPALSELAAHSGLDDAGVRHLLQLPRNAVCIDDTAPDKDAALLHAANDAGPDFDPGEALDRACFCRGIEQTLHHLPPVQALVVRMRFGIGLHQEYSLAHIGRLFGLSRERIRQIEAKALRSLRELTKETQLRFFFR